MVVRFKARRLTMLGSLRGHGHLVADEAEPAAVTYELDIFRDSARTIATGRVEGKASALAAAGAAAHAVLVLQDGAQVSVTLSDVSGPTAEVTTTGPVPGF
jgi:hypothetical protein